MTQERRRYGFVLERQCSLAKHYLAYHSQGSTILQRHLEDWQEVAQTREFLPDSVEVMFTNRLRVSTSSALDFVLTTYVRGFTLHTKKLFFTASEFLAGRRLVLFPQKPQYGG